MVKIFISYSHTDEVQRENLDKHLVMLKREGKVDTWHDRKLLPGSDIDNDIDSNLLDSQIIVLLVSPDFLASNYCYCTEMNKAFELKKQSKIHIIPVILDYCGWQHSPIGNILAVPKDGKPISDYPNPNKAFWEVAEKIREVVNSIIATSDSPKPKPKEVSSISQKQEKIVDPARSSNLRIRKEFTDHDKDSFRKDGFEYIKRFFKNSLEELKERNPDIEINFELQDANSFVSSIYRNGSRLTQCLIVNQLGNMLGDITFSTSLDRSSCNGSIKVENDDVQLYFCPWMSFGQEKEKLSSKGAAEHLWDKFIEPLQR